MPEWLIYMLPWLSVLVFVTAVGACIGSLVNVLVYRLPLGLDVIVPTSRCPKCDHKLTWRENIPIFGWLLLRGKCRFCKAKISPEYPIVETVVALLFGGIWALWYVIPDQLGRDTVLGSIAPEWALNGAAMTWPATVVLLVLVGCLVAMTIIDARTSTIRLELTWVPAGVALVLHTAHAWWFYHKYGNPAMMPGLEGAWIVPNAPRMKWLTAPGEVWTLATGGLANWKFIGMGIGGTIGLGVSILMLRFKLLTRSFSDFDEWYEQHHKETKQLLNASSDQPAEIQADSDRLASPDPVVPVPAESADELPVAAEETPESGMDDWLQYPHARREMVKELAFLCPPVMLAFLGSWLATLFVSKQYGPWTHDSVSGQMIAPANAPLWLVVLGGVLMGYLIAGGVVWAIRIGGTMAFGKEAMGLGDVHMMAAVGACLGWIDPTLAFFLAAFVGVAYAIVAQVFRGKLSKAMPYGPFLAVATMMVVLGKPLVEMGLGRLFGMDAPMNLP
ncbi:MAG: prepilin peptidase [Phycisphaerales bacterium]|nr:prepilin peptidase [Phycisphaerales bacterium]